MLSDLEIILKLSKPKSEDKPMKVLQIIKILYPIAKSIVEDVQAAKHPKSDGGKKVTKAETQEIIFTNLIEAIPAIEEVVKTL